MDRSRDNVPRSSAELKLTAEEMAREHRTTPDPSIVTAAAENPAAVKAAGDHTDGVDLSAFDRFMSRTGGQPPRPGDELPA